MFLTPERIIIVRGSVIVIGTVKDSDSVFRITVDGVFRGYIQILDGEYQMMAGCVMSIYKFNTIVEAMKMGINQWNKL
ncbi:hypothetical protein GCM10022246_31960 [Pedobacter ginsengiterrae]|uniref:Uncharacterized protein n=1 Tax=Pedobacter ginsengiterrae TaxID=871696 RepID=A0ABP7Q6S6_9SPHI|nr:hypothetical protein [Pedobacter aquatilis]